MIEWFQVLNLWLRIVSWFCSLYNWIVGWYFMIFFINNLRICMSSFYLFLWIGRKWVLWFFLCKKLVVQQVINLYQTKQPILKAYRNEVLDLIDNFFLAFNIHLIPKSENKQADSLAISGSNFRPPLPLKLKYDVELRCRPNIPDQTIISKMGNPSNSSTSLWPYQLWKPV